MAATGMPMETGQLNRCTSISSREVSETLECIGYGLSGVGVGIAAGGSVAGLSGDFDAPGSVVAGVAVALGFLGAAFGLTGVGVAVAAGLATAGVMDCPELAGL